MMDELKKQTNVDVELRLFPYETATERLNLDLNSGDYADVIAGWTLSDNLILNYGVNQGVFVPLEEYFEKSCPKITEILNLKGVREKMTAPDGHIYSIPYVVEDDLVGYTPYINGQWLENEVQSYLLTKPQDLAMIKTPVISSIVKTLENKSMTDETLSAVIDAIDKGETSYPGVSEKDFSRISEARHMVYSATFDHCCAIPAKSKNKPLAMEFLKFMASDMGQSIYAKYLNGLTMPYGYDVGDKVTDFVRSRYENFSDYIPICIDFSSPLVYRQGLTAYTTGNGAGLDGVLYKGNTAEWVINDTKTTLMASWDKIILAAKQEK